MRIETSKFHVPDRATFIQFLNWLKQDFTNNPDDWENRNLADFLEALAPYTEAIQGFYDNTGQNVNADEASWQLFADILSGATMYD